MTDITHDNAWKSVDENQPISLEAIARTLSNSNGLLAGHYGFTAEELDFILNCDIKYRRGRDIESEEED